MSPDPTRSRWIFAFIVLAACSLDGFEQDLKPPGALEEGGTPGRGSGGAPHGGTAGNGLERPRGGASGKSSATGSGGSTTLDPAVSGATGDGGRASAGSATEGGIGGAQGGAASGGGASEADSAGAGGAEPGAPPPLFFSEYVEGSSNNKALEITSTEDGSLGGCAVRIYSNGAKQPSKSFALRGAIAAYEPLVICHHALAGFEGCDERAQLLFNGDDVLELVCRGESLDSIGQVGARPPAGYWGTETLRTVDMTLRRSCTITAGDRNPEDEFDPSLEWIGAPSDSFEDLGTHCASAP